MHLRRKFVAAALATGLVLGAAQAGWAAPKGATDAAGPAARSAKGVTVTLLTGDRITLASVVAGGVAVKPAKGREEMRFTVHRDRDSLYVIPGDAEPLIRAGKLDRRLFDVRGLARAGYHDAVRDTLPLLVRYGAVSARSAAGTLSAAGATVTRELSVVDGAAVAARKESASRLWGTLKADRGFDRIWLDGKREISLDQSVPQIGAPEAWEAGYTGAGVTVAVLDTGIDTAHPDLAGKVSESRNFSETPEAGDTVGHGTHVASTIAGSGAASAGKYKGVAPDATLLSGKVCETSFCSESAMLAGMEWAAAEKGADVVNFSIGGGDTPEIDPLEEAINTLTAEHGTLFVVAAGNSGSADGTVESPGSAEAALTVGAVDKSEELAGFSSRGPRVGDDGLKPDITAPGVDIVAARAAGTAMGDPVGEQYTTASGTSMATPHVTGAAALLVQQHPDWKAGSLKATLMASARPNPALTAYQQGAGRVDVGRAIAQGVTTDPVSVSYGRPRWPHNDDEPVARTVTYHNSGTADVALDLAVTATGPDGEPAVAGLFTASATTLTVPAGGQAQVTVTADTRVPGPDGLYSGQLVATGGSAVVRTPLGVHKEVESYNVSVTLVDHDGNPSGISSASLLSLDEFRWIDLYDEDGTATMRVPKGRYNLSALLLTDRGEEVAPAISLQARPVFEVTSDVSAMFDARDGKPVTTTVPESTAVPALVDIMFTQDQGDFGYGVGLWAESFDEVSTLHIGPRAEGFSSYVASQWAKENPDGTFAGSPYFYGIAESFVGRLPNGYVKHVRRGDLATVRQEFGSAAEGLFGERIIFPVLEPDSGASAIVLDTALPGSRSEYLYARGARWSQELDISKPSEDPEGFPEVQALLFQPAVKYRPGQVYKDAWYTAPFGPALPTAGRTGDTIVVDVPLYGDRAGHAGFSRTDTSRTALYRGGELVGETEESAYGFFEVPPEPADYRVEVADTRSVGDLTTEVRGVWTFQSAHVPDEDELTPLPLSVFRFTPRLDVDNAAPAGRSFQIPVTVQGSAGAPGGKVRSLAVDVSYDDGKTWQKAQVRRDGSGWVATVKHPDAAGFVSLRASGTDAGGNTATQTVVHAYRLK
ncbi:S8 family serine peptidase [Phytohabitans sp. ZYX-F-186]|uniref:S8 family serine peptidase n=1 Tax=Phytohabitans maris TaxID=3071409 RepID=A0ABU0ZW11_9ACTN|nr:S8 family serine peptidase [Phytohabitans sp. ZYX-F-186]MDQ7910509.1 S8 family serine peptidase [Phytohabitans sp. ZYX-F-186]